MINKPSTETRQRDSFEKLYAHYNHRCWADPDPIIMVYKAKAEDQELTAFLSAIFAYGRVASILQNLDKILTILAPIKKTLLTTNRDKLEKQLAGFKYRFTTQEELIALLLLLKEIINEHKSLENHFLLFFNPNDTNILPALSLWISELLRRMKLSKHSLLPQPSMGSACKRLFLFFRWMVRSDQVDPGLWKKVPASKLIIPLDTHMYRFCSRLGFTARKSMDLKTAEEITEAFRKLNPEDPVKYDFALTRLGIRGDKIDKIFYSSLI
ncbi:MAG: TIGR02757 family protein [Spirochaetales bacterium]|nr:TIGR02757 family protein [Spirochaetales bacterium]